MKTLTSIDLTHNQQESWFLHHLQGDSVNDKIYLAIKFHQRVVQDQLETSIKQLVKRHFVFKTSYQENEGKLRQKIASEAKVKLKVVEASNYQGEALKNLILAEAKGKFNPAIAPLIRFTLFCDSGEGDILLITLHTLIGDWDSLRQLTNELLDLYALKELSPIEANYQDYCLAETKLEFQKLSKYWQKELGETLPVLSLPTYLPRPPLRSYQGKTVTTTLSPEIKAKVEAIATAQNLSLESIFLTIYKILLSRYTRETDILVGINHRDNNWDGVVGNLSNVVVSRDELGDNPRVEQLLQQVQQQLTKISEYRQYPFTLLVKDYQSNNDFSRSPVCQVSLAYRDLTELQSLCGLWEKPTEIELYSLGEQKVDFDLNLEILDLNETTILNFHYNYQVVETEIVEQLSRHFQNLLIEIVSGKTETAIAELNLLSEAEKQGLIEAGNATKIDYPLQPLQDLVTQQAEKTPEAIALIFEEQSLTYAELNQRANQLAHYLQKRGVKPEVLVGIAVERSLEMVIGLLGILKAGGAYIPIDPHYPQERIEYLLADSQVSILLSQEHLISTLPPHQAEVICLDRDWQNIATESQENPHTEISLNNLAYVIYTSGSTGKPKGAMNTHQGIANRLLWMQETYKLTCGDRVLQKTPFSFDVSVWEFFWTLITGATLVIAKPGGHKDSNYLVDLIASTEITTLHFVPSMLQVFLETKGLEQLTSLKRVICSGEALTWDLQQRFYQRLDCELHNLYGPTEAAIDVTAWKCPRDSKYPIVPIGKAIANISLYVLDSYLQPVPLGVGGELHIGGIGVARGYLNREELTALKFIPNPFNPSDRLYKTGDLVRHLPDGNLEYLGRLDDQVKIRGFRIELGEINKVLLEHPQIQEATVIVQEHQQLGKQLVAYLVSKSSEPTPETLRYFLKAKLPEYMVPSAFVFLTSLPVTPNGKLNRRALPLPDWSAFSSQREYIAPRNEIEAKLASIWSEILNLPQISVNDRFFDLGGHSLLAVNLMAKIEHHFGKTLPLAALFTYPTIAELAQRLSQDEDSTSFSPLVPIQPQGTKEPFFCVHPAGGHVLCYVNLSRYLGGDQPFYGLQAQGFNAGEEALISVEAMASLYVRTIREFKPQGPYQVGGWSFGGVVAYEVAQQLRQAGEEVSNLAILDSYVPILLNSEKKIDDIYLVGVLSRVFGGMFGLDNLVSSEELEGLTVTAQLDYIIDKARQVGIFPPEVSGQQNRRILDVLVGTLKATYSYRRKPYPGKVTVFRAQEKHIMAPDPTLVWVELFAILDAEEIEIVKVPGNHYTFILEPHVQELGAKLREKLS